MKKTIWVLVILSLFIYSCGERKNTVTSDSGYQIVATIPPIGVFRHLYIDQQENVGYISADYAGIIPIDLVNPSNPAIQDVLYNNLMEDGVLSSYYSNYSGNIYLEVMTAASGQVRGFTLDSILTQTTTIISGGSPPVRKFKIDEFIVDPQQYAFGDSIYLYLADPGETHPFVREVFLNTGTGFIPARFDNYDHYQVYDFAIQAEYGFFAIDEFGLEIVNVVDPTFPEVGYFDTEGFCRGVDVQGNYCYLADWHWGLQVLDISNPANPQRVANLKFEGADDCEWVKVSGDKCVIMDRYNGVYAVDISDPLNPEMVFNFDTVTPINVELAGSYIYVIDEDAGLIIAEWL